MNDILFLTVIAWIWADELDAVQKREWRLLRRHPKYEFHDPLSHLLIFGAVPLAALHLAMLIL